MESVLQNFNNIKTSCNNNLFVDIIIENSSVPNLFEATGFIKNKDKTIFQFSARESSKKKARIAVAIVLIKEYDNLTINFSKLSISNSSAITSSFPNNPDTSSFLNTTIPYSDPDPIYKEQYPYNSKSANMKNTFDKNSTSIRFKGILTLSSVNNNPISPIISQSKPSMKPNTAKIKSFLSLMYLLRHLKQNVKIGILLLF